MFRVRLGGFAGLERQTPLITAVGALVEPHQLTGTPGVGVEGAQAHRDLYVMASANGTAGAGHGSRVRLHSIRE